MIFVEINRNQFHFFFIRTWSFQEQNFRFYNRTASVRLFPMFHFHNYMSILNPALVAFLPKFYKIKGLYNSYGFLVEAFFSFFTIKHLLIKRISITQPISSPQKTTRKYCKITPFSIFGLYSWLSRILNMTFKNRYNMLNAKTKFAKGKKCMTHSPVIEDLNP